MLRTFALASIFLISISAPISIEAKTLLKDVSKTNSKTNSKSKPKRKLRRKTRRITVLQISKPNAAAYEEPSFDARIIINLKKGQKLYGLKKKIQGADGLGLFYKVRLKKGVYAYVLDTEIKGFKASIGLVRDSKSHGGSAQASEKGGGKNVEERAERSDSYKGYSIPYSKSYGLILSSIDYGVKTKSGSRSSKEMFFGLKLSGAGWFNNRIPLDVSILYSPSSPKLFDSFTQGHSGSMLFLEGAIPLEWKKGERWSVYGSVGAVVSYYAFDLILGGKTGGIKETHLGYSLGLGGGLRFGRYLFKLELKYIKSGEKHIGSYLTLQRIF